MDKLSTYITLLIAPKVKKPRTHQNESFKDTKHYDVNKDVYGQDIDLGDDAKSDLGEFSKYLRDMNSGTNSFLLHEPLKDFPGVYPVPAVASLNSIMVKVAVEGLRTELMKALNRSVEKGELQGSPTLSKINYKGQDYDINTLPEQMVNDIIKDVNDGKFDEIKLEGPTAEEGKAEDKEGKAKDKEGEAGGLGLPEPKAEGGIFGANPPPEQGGGLDELNQAIEGLGKAAAVEVKKRPAGGYFPINFEQYGEDYVSQPEQTDNKQEVKESGRYKKEIEPNMESKPYIQDGNFKDNPEAAYLQDSFYATHYFFGI